MSEFTFGNIIRSVDKPKLVQHLPKGTPILGLSDVWTAFFTPKDGESGAPQLVALSEHCPIMYFSHAEDHGWGFEIFHKGAIVSNLEIQYEMLDEEDEDLPGIYGEIVRQRIEELQEEESHRNPNAEAFRLFGLEDQRILALEELLAGDLGLTEYDDEQYEDDDGDDDEALSPVERFKSILGIEEMSWIRYERTEDRDGIEYIK